MAKGHTNNPNGRPKGKPNKSTQTMKDWIVEFLSNNREVIESDFDCLDPKERLAFVAKLLPYVIPKMENQDAGLQDSYKIVVE